SKQELFSQAVRISVAGAGAGAGAEAGAEDRPRTGGPEALTDSLLASLGMKIGGLPEASLAMLRSMLTHPEAAEAARAALGHQIAEVAAAISAPAGHEVDDRAEDDARLRAALAVATMVGVTIGHQLLGIDDLRRASPEEIAAALRPALHALVTGAE
ncbi:TetR/AcrR family transcriptional regulator, partial [Streptomyces sp. MCAF7]